MHFVDLIWKKWGEIGKTGYFDQKWRKLGEVFKIASFSNFSPFFPKQIHKMHKITSLEDGKRKILTQKFWSHGTSLGHLGPLPQEALGLGSGRLQFLVIWGPYELPILVASHGTPKSLKAARSQCALPAYCKGHIWASYQLKRSRCVYKVPF